MGLIEQHPEFAYGLLLIMVSIIGWFINRKVNEMEKDIHGLKVAVTEIRGNYLDRFDDIKDRMNRQHDEMLKEMTKLTIMIEKQAAYCTVVQDMKKLKKRSGIPDI